ncbi:phosphate ABC transporter permease [Carbonactinospora thermoautotrophica]|uniref:Phosphate transport system permease protein PstA n=1 Tax=Carbonactinospora thermoautotrophica TaxID=1469144 RepID=A0A132MJF3_9ACTN|nr:phosphate ABC transporter permease [Carbonactinospora thermoautotrophica]KWX08607.1 phosphate ABC transporter permease [Carbonactinospora thermoautotrophica]
MTTTTFTDRAMSPIALRGRRLPHSALWVIASAVAALLGLALFLTGHRSYGLFAALYAPVYTVTLTVVSGVVEGWRHAKDRVATALVTMCFVLALLPLVSVLAYTVLDGIGRLDWYFLQHSMRNVGPRDDAGGAYHAIVGTLEQVGLATLIAVPVGLLTAVYLVEYGRGRLAKAVTFFVDVMTGIPSIVAGLFILSAFILLFGFRYAGVFGAMALAILMIPVVVRSAEEMLKLVPDALREAAYALGVPKWKTVLRVVMPTALTGIVTGVMLAVARVMGETAPLLLTTFYLPSINMNPFYQPQASLPVFVWTEWQKGLPIATERAAAGALTLILLVMLLNLIARLIAWWKAPKTDR